MKRRHDMSINKNNEVEREIHKKNVLGIWKLTSCLVNVHDKTHREMEQATQV